MLSRVNSIEEGKLGLRNETEQRGRVESTLTSLHQRITDLEKGSPTGEENQKKTYGHFCFISLFPAHHMKVSFHFAVIHANGPFLKCKKGHILLLGRKKKLLHEYRGVMQEHIWGRNLTKPSPKLV